jgi:hypothetical protein
MLVFTTIILLLLLKLLIMRKTLLKLTAGGTLMIALILQSCTKQAQTKLTTQNDFSNSSLIRVYVATVNAARNYVYVDGKPLNGASLTSGSIFPASGVYASNISTGFRAFLVRDTLTAATQIPLSFSENMQINKYYTIFLYDSINAPNQKTVTTNIIVPSDTSARIRFANFVHTKVGISAIDIFSARKNSNVATNLQVTDVTDFIPYPSDLTDTFYVRVAGSATNLMNITPPTPPPGNVLTPISSIFTPRPKRSYTLVFRGSYSAVLTNAPQVRTLSVFTDR